MKRARFQSDIKQAIWIELRLIRRDVRCGCIGRCVRYTNRSTHCPGVIFVTISSTITNIPRKPATSIQNHFRQLDVRHLNQMPIKCRLTMLPKLP